MVRRNFFTTSLIFSWPHELNCSRVQNVRHLKIVPTLQGKAKVINKLLLLLKAASKMGTILDRLVKESLVSYIFTTL